MHDDEDGPPKRPPPPLGRFIVDRGLTSLKQAVLLWNSLDTATKQVREGSVMFRT